MKRNMPMIKTHLDHLNEARSDGLVVYLGMPKSGNPAALNGAEVYSDFGGTPLSKIYEIDPTKMKNGLDIVINTEEYGLFKQAFRSAQNYLAFVFCKFVFFPKLSLKVGDPLGVRKDNFVDVFHEINHLDNLSFLLKYPLLEKLAHVRIGKPALILLPGPSLHEVGERLPELSKKMPYHLPVEDRTVLSRPGRRAGFRHPTGYLPAPAPVLSGRRRVSEHLSDSHALRAHSYLCRAIPGAFFHAEFRFECAAQPLFLEKIVLELAAGVHGVDRSAWFAGSVPGGSRFVLFIGSEPILRSSGRQ